MLEQRGSFQCPLLLLPGFIIEYVMADLMHTGCLGIVCYLLGNVLYELFKQVGGTLKKPTQALGVLRNMIELAAKQLGKSMPLSDLTLGMIRSQKGKPKLAAKAAEARHTLPLVSHMLEFYFGCESTHDKLRLDCTKLLALA